MIISTINSHIIDRLKRIKRAADTSINVYGPGAARPKGDMEPPCFVVSHYLDTIEDTRMARRFLDDYEGSDTEATFIWPYGENDSNEPLEITGPESWTHRKWPLPIVLYYQIDIKTVDEDHAGQLSLMLLRLFPKGYNILLDDNWIKFQPEGHPVNLDEVDKPLFWRAHRFVVTGAWVNALESDEVVSLSEYNWQVGFMPETLEEAL
jgi:hypothetical protein